MSQSRSSVLWFSILMTSLERLEKSKTATSWKMLKLHKQLFIPSQEQSCHFWLAWHLDAPLSWPLRYLFTCRKRLKLDWKAVAATVGQSMTAAERDWPWPPQCNKPRKCWNVIKVLANVAAPSGISDALDVCSYFTVTSWGCPCCFMLLPLQPPFLKARRWVESLKNRLAFAKLAETLLSRPFSVSVSLFKGLQDKVWM